jgi:hypothetical protein
MRITIFNSSIKAGVMSVSMQLLSTLEYLGAYDNAARSGKDIYFGLVIQVAAPNDSSGNPAVVTDADAPLLQPWSWTDIKPQLWTFNTAITKQIDIQGWAQAPSLGDAVTQKLSKNFTDALNQKDLGWTNGTNLSVKPGAQQHSWPAQLAQVGRYPYPIPHRLNLAYLLKVNQADLATSNAWVATVGFSVKLNGVSVAFQPNTFREMETGSGSVQFTFTSTSAHLVTGVTQQALRDVRFPSVNATPEVTDWQSQLTTMTANAFDLPTRLVQLVRNPPTADDAFTEIVAENFGSYVRAVLIALRDFVGYGNLIGPDGGSALSRALRLWVARQPQSKAVDLNSWSSALTKWLQDGYTTAIKDDSLSLDRWIATLLNNPDLANCRFLPQVPRSAAGVKPFIKGMALSTGDVVVHNQHLWRALRDVSAGVVAPDSNPAVEPGAPNSEKDWIDLGLGMNLPVNVWHEHVSDRLLAVEEMQNCFLQSDVLARIVFSQWKDALKYFPSVGNTQQQQIYASWTAQFLNQALDILYDMDVRGMLLRGNLQNSWDAILSAPKPLGVPVAASLNRDQMRTNLTRELVDVRMPNQLRIGQADVYPFAPKMIAQLRTWMTQNIDDILPQRSSGSRAYRSGVSEGLSVAIEAEHALGGSGDRGEFSSGLCVLMKESTTTAWRCLNLAYANSGSDGTLTPLLPDLSKQGIPIVVPVPEHIQDGLRRAILTYNNQPLMAESPAHGFSKAGLIQNPTSQVERMITFQHPAITESLDQPINSWKKIPGLGFGRKYDFYFAWVSNAGALPPELAAPGAPGVLAQPDKLQVKPTIQAMPYCRTVPINMLRIGKLECIDTRNRATETAWPAIPADVYPFAQELGLLPDVSNKDGARPLLMVNSSDLERSGHFKIPIFRPTTDLLTCDRWQVGLGDHTLRETRRRTWAAFHYQARRESRSVELLLDDPAVTGLKLTVKAFGAPIVKQGDPITWKAPDLTHWSWDEKAPTLPPTSSAIDLHVMAVSADSVTIEPLPKGDALGWKISVPQGVVLEVTLTPQVDATKANFFSGNALPSISDYTFLVEATSTNMPTADAIRNSFSIATAGRDLTFALALDPLPDNQRRVCHGADLRLQNWRWDGRPCSFPADQMVDTIPSPTPAGLLAWEVDGFLNRPLTDATTRAMARKSGGGYTYTSIEERSTEQGAAYYRAAVTVYNRYGSMVPADKRVVNTLDTTIGSLPGNDAGWKRKFVCSMLTQDYRPPKPAVKFILPLTSAEGAANPEAASSVLVVMQGPWYAVGGLIEEFSAEVVQAGDQAAHPEDAEIGPDPIMYQGKQDDILGAAANNMNVDQIKRLMADAFEGCLRGPIGHTFDSSDTNPLWVNTSYVLDPPQLNGKPALPGTFARMSFRRVLRKQGLYPIPQKGVKDTRKDLVSDATDPMWVQFLPGASSLLGLSMDGLTFEVNATAVIMSPKGKLQFSLDTHLDVSHTMIALLVTERVSDMVGRKNQERFVDILVNMTNGAQRGMAEWDRGKLSQNANYVARVVMIQRHQAGSPKPPKTGDDLWLELFPQSADEDAVSRIIAVSPPISAQQLNCAAAPSQKR